MTLKAVNNNFEKSSVISIFYLKFFLYKTCGYLHQSVDILYKKQKKEGKYLKKQKSFLSKVLKNETGVLPLTSSNCKNFP